MMIVGLGTDIVEIERLADVYQRNPRFASRIFTQRELSYCLRRQNCYPHLAARFAAKEAVAKAFGRSLSWQDVEIENNGDGKPEVRLHGDAKEFASGKQVMLTMSHSRVHATAVAIVLEEQR